MKKILYTTLIVAGFGAAAIYDQQNMALSAETSIKITQTPAYKNDLGTAFLTDKSDISTADGQ